MDVSLAPRPPHLVPAGLLADPPPASWNVVRWVSSWTGPEPVVLAVVGAPGSGKTTLLRYTAAGLPATAAAASGAAMPVLLYLRDHVPAISPTRASRWRTCCADARRAACRGTGRLAGAAAGAGECVVLLDGLDEVARQEDRGQVAAWAERQVRQYRRNGMSSPHGRGLRHRGSDGARVFARSAALPRAGGRIRTWLVPGGRAAQHRRGRRVSPSGPKQAPRICCGVWTARPALHDLTVNPLLLTMIANVHRYRGALPAAAPGCTRRSAGHAVAAAGGQEPPASWRAIRRSGAARTGLRDDAAAAA